MDEIDVARINRDSLHVGRIMDSASTLARIERQVRQLRIYSLVSSVALVILCATAFTLQGSQQGRFTVLDVERLNVVGADGKYAVVIATPARLPGNVIGGKEHPANGNRGGGLLFYNRQGDEAGGLVFDSEPTDTTVRAFGQLSLDRYGSDQVAAVRYVEGPEGWTAGLQVSHFVRGALFEWHAARDSILRLPQPARDSAMQALRRRFIREGKWEIPRVFVGEQGKNAMLTMRDTRGRQRFRVVVDSLDVAKLEFLNDSGRVVYRLPNQ